MTLRRQAPWLFLALLWVAAGCERSEKPWAVSVGTVRFHPAAADPGVVPPPGDPGWREVAFGDLPLDPGPFWIAGEVTVPDGYSSSRPLAVFVAAIASHELSWDGRLLGRGGWVGATAAAEEPGPIETQYLVPVDLAGPGRHRILLRASAFHRGLSFSHPWWGIVVGDYDGLLLGRRWYSWLAFTSASGLLLGAGFALVVFFLDRRDRSALVLGGLCVVTVLLLVAESWRATVGYTYDHHWVRLVTVTALSWLFSVLLVAFVVVRFPLPGRRWMVLVLPALLVSLTAPGWDGKASGMFLLGLVAALVWALRALRRRRPGAFATVGGVGGSLGIFLLDPILFGNLTLFFAVDLLVACLGLSHVLAARQDRRAREEEERRSERLEAELLRRQLQPHFLMNTLAALREWIDLDPAEAGEMVQDLAEELRLLGELSRARRVRLGDELRLCRLHLAVMARRRDRRYSLETEGVAPDAEVPPALFHVLVENAVTHHVHDGDGEVVIRLTGSSNGGATRYIVEAPLGSGWEPPERIEEGTGLRYVRARLAESYGDRWSLEAGAAGDVWRTVVTVPEEG